MEKQETLINDLSQGPVLSKLARFAVPIMLANLLQAVYSMVDMIVVGQFGGPAGLSAVGIGGQLQTLFLAIGMAFPTAVKSSSLSRWAPRARKSPAPSAPCSPQS